MKKENLNAMIIELNMERILLIILILISIFNGIFLLKSYNNVNKWDQHHYRCYYFTEKTECAKTKFCATHITEEKCEEYNGLWLLETEQNEAFEQYYFMTQPRENGNP